MVNIAPKASIHDYTHLVPLITNPVSAQLKSNTNSRCRSR